MLFCKNKSNLLNPNKTEKKINKTKCNLAFFLPFSGNIHNYVNAKLIIVKFNFIAVSFFIQYFTICSPHVAKFCFSLASFKIPILLAVTLSVMLTCVPLKSYLFEKKNFSYYS